MELKLTSGDDWRSQLSKIPIPLSVKNDTLLSQSLETLINGGRISKDIGSLLHRNSNLPGLTALARMIKYSRFGNNIFFNENLHVNMTNICTLACRFCAFRKGSRHSDAYSLTAEDFTSRIEPYHGIIDEVHAVGGLHPEWTIENYREIIRNCLTVLIYCS